MLLLKIRFVLSKSNLMLVAALCGACTTAPLSFIEGVPPLGTLPLKHYPLRVVAVDSSIQFSMPIQIAPGIRTLVLEASAGASAKGTTQRTFAFKVEPCTRYYLLAYRESPVNANWELVLHSKEKVSGCDALEEGKKSSAITTLPQA